MDYNDCLTISVYRDLESTSSFSAAQWDVFIRQARRAHLLSKMALLLQSTKAWEHIPDYAKLHLESAIVSSGALKRTVMREIQLIHKALQDTNISYVFLKGAAYHIAELRAGDGRLFNDVDIIVAKDNIDQVEQTLIKYGWKSSHHSAYDDRYYRRWMHEIPPLQHVSRGSVIDLHHAILPLTADLKPDSRLLMASSQSVVSGELTYAVLSPIDMILHSATHLFHEGELDKGLRDLMDLDTLFAEFDQGQINWNDMVPRAETLQLSLPLFYAVRYCRSILRTSIPASVVDKLTQLHGGRRINALMDALFYRALLPEHKSCKQKLTSIARYFLFIRGHYLRMPLSLLIPHLLRKMFVKE